MQIEIPDEWIKRKAEEEGGYEISAGMSQPMGCICPPTSEQTCENQLCPRKAIPGMRFNNT